MKKFETESGSVYEIDQSTNRLRRLSGAEPGTVLRGTDGEWHSYINVTEISPGRPLLVDWVWGKRIITSPILRVHT